ncbi:MAG: hypothetical protein ACM3SR_06445 [Ignavibacteriales bacterium]
MNKIKPSKKKVNSSESPAILEKDNSIKGVYSVLVRKRAEIIFTSCEKEEEEIVGKWADESVAETLGNEYIEIASGVPKRIVLSKTSPLRRGWDYLCKMAEVGLKIKELFETDDSNLAAEIIRQLPEFIFDDGIETAISLLSSKFLKQWRFPKSSNFGKMFPLPWGDKFYNPIIDVLDWWRELIIWGNPKQQKEAMEYIKKSGLLEYFNPEKRRGAKEALTKSDRFPSTKPFEDPLSLSYEYRCDRYKKELIDRCQKIKKALDNNLGRFDSRIKIPKDDEAARTRKIINYLKKSKWDSFFSAKEIQSLALKTNSEIAKHIVAKQEKISVTTLERETRVSQLLSDLQKEIREVRERNK